MAQPANHAATVIVVMAIAMIVIMLVVMMVTYRVIPHGLLPHAADAAVAGLKRILRAAATT